MKAASLHVSFFVFMVLLLAPAYGQQTPQCTPPDVWVRASVGGYCASPIKEMSVSADDTARPIRGRGDVADIPHNLTPREHGLFWESSTGAVPIEGQVVSFVRTGSLLASAATIGIKSAKNNVQILGKTSQHVTASKPVFYYRAAEGNVAAGGSAGDLLLVKMKRKGNRRQFEVAASGVWRASRGISLRAQLQVFRKQVEPNLYRLTPAEELEAGEYGWFLFRGYDLPGFVYDFTVE